MMANGNIGIEAIAPDMLTSTFTEISGHTTLGAEFNVASGVFPENNAGLASLPIGTKLFVKHEQRPTDPAYDAVAMVMGHADEKIQLISLTPKDGGRWGVHNAYEEVASEIPDALAALDRLFDPKVEFGSIAVLSETTGQFIGVSTNTSKTIGSAGCSSHDQKRLAPTLTMSQLLDNYTWRAITLLPDSHLVRRDGDGTIIHLLPGQRHSEQPTKKLRDQRSMLDRIQRLTGKGSVLSELTPAAVLRGIETAVSRGAFTDKDRPVSSVANIIKRSAESLII